MIKGIIFDWETGLKEHYETNREEVEKTLLSLRIKQYRLGLIAEGIDVSKFSSMLRKTRLGEYFDVTALSTSPEPENYRNCIESMKTNFQSTLLIGDAKQCERAKAYGMQTFTSNGRLIIPNLENITLTSLEETMFVS